MRRRHGRKAAAASAKPARVPGAPPELVAPRPIMTDAYAWHPEAWEKDYISNFPLACKDSEGNVVMIKPVISDASGRTIFGFLPESVAAAVKCSKAEVMSAMKVVADYDSFLQHVLDVDRFRAEQQGLAVITHDQEFNDEPGDNTYLQPESGPVGMDSADYDATYADLCDENEPDEEEMDHRMSERVAEICQLDRDRLGKRPPGHRGGEGDDCDDDDDDGDDDGDDEYMYRTKRRRNAPASCANMYEDDGESGFYGHHGSTSRASTCDGESTATYPYSATDAGSTAYTDCDSLTDDASVLTDCGFSAGASASVAGTRGSTRSQRTALTALSIHSRVASISRSLFRKITEPNSRAKRLLGRYIFPDSTSTHPGHKIIRLEALPFVLKRLDGPVGHANQDTIRLLMRWYCLSASKIAEDGRTRGHRYTLQADRAMSSVRNVLRRLTDTPFAAWVVRKLSALTSRALSELDLDMDNLARSPDQLSSCFDDMKRQLEARMCWDMCLACNLDPVALKAKLGHGCAWLATNLDNAIERFASKAHQMCTEGGHSQIQAYSRVRKEDLRDMIAQAISASRSIPSTGAGAVVDASLRPSWVTRNTTLFTEGSEASGLWQPRMEGSVHHFEDDVLSMMCSTVVMPPPPDVRYAPYPQKVRASRTRTTLEALVAQRLHSSATRHMGSHAVPTQPPAHQVAVPPDVPECTTSTGGATGTTTKKARRVQFVVGVDESKRYELMAKKNVRVFFPPGMCADDFGEVLVKQARLLRRTHTDRGECPSTVSCALLAAHLREAVTSVNPKGGKPRKWFNGVPLTGSAMCTFGDEHAEAKIAGIPYGIKTVSEWDRVYVCSVDLADGRAYLRHTSPSSIPFRYTAHPLNPDVRMIACRTDHMRYVGAIHTTRVLEVVRSMEPFMPRLASRLYGMGMYTDMDPHKLRQSMIPRVSIGICQESRLPIHSYIVPVEYLIPFVEMLNLGRSHSDISNFGMWESLCKILYRFSSSHSSTEGRNELSVDMASFAADRVMASMDYHVFYDVSAEMEHVEKWVYRLKQGVEAFCAKVLENCARGAHQSKVLVDEMARRAYDTVKEFAVAAEIPIDFAKFDEHVKHARQVIDKAMCRTGRGVTAAAFPDGTPWVEHEDGTVDPRADFQRMIDMLSKTASTHSDSLHAEWGELDSVSRGGDVVSAEDSLETDSTGSDSTIAGGKAARGAHDGGGKAGDRKLTPEEVQEALLRNVHRDYLVTLVKQEDSDDADHIQRVFARHMTHRYASLAEYPVRFVHSAFPIDIFENYIPITLYTSTRRDKVRIGCCAVSFEACTSISHEELQKVIRAYQFALPSRELEGITIGKELYPHPFGRSSKQNVNFVPLWAVAAAMLYGKNGSTAKLNTSYRWHAMQYMCCIDQAIRVCEELEATPSSTTHFTPSGRRRQRQISWWGDAAKRKAALSALRDDEVATIISVACIKTGSRSEIADSKETLREHLMSIPDSMKDTWNAHMALVGRMREMYTFQESYMVYIAIKTHRCIREVLGAHVDYLNLHAVTLRGASSGDANSDTPQPGAAP